MRKRDKTIVCILAFLATLVLVLDAKTAYNGAYDGVLMCLKTVLPSLFPFVALSVYLNGNMSDGISSILRPLGKFCRIPEGAETILLLGLIGGYPVGAKCISEAYQARKLKQTDSRRMLGFCSNAGPAFIFGMAGFIFDKSIIVWALWGVHILSALLTGFVLPGNVYGKCGQIGMRSTTISGAVENSAKTMALICSWIIIFRVLIAFGEKWFLWLLPNEMQALIVGILELSNGMLQLNSIDLVGMRFVIASMILAFGGICVAMQTVSVTSALGSGLYFPGKVIQLVVSFILASVMQCLLFPVDEWWFSPLIFAAILTLAVSLFTAHVKKQKKDVAICC